MYNFSKRSFERMQGVHPELIMIFTEAIKNSPIDFGIPGDGGLRTAMRQREMHLDPKIETKCDGIIDKSNHQIKPDGFGYALDFYAYVDGQASWNEHHLSMVAGVIMAAANRLLKEGKISHKLYWGGQFGCADFSGWDMPHMELVKL